MQPIEVDLSPNSGYAAVVTLCGEHDLATQSDLAAALAPLRGSVLVDATGCEFIDSTTIGVILAKSRELKREGYELALTYESGNAVARVLEVIRIDTLLTVHRRSPADPGTPDAGHGDAEQVTA